MSGPPPTSPTSGPGSAAPGGEGRRRRRLGLDDVRRLASVDSTNRLLLDEARAGRVGPSVVVADHQTAGRGRLGRTWTAPAGSNLLVSVLVRPGLPPTRHQLVAAAVAVAAHDAVRSSTGLAVGIKWPNDLLAPDGRKLAGVLAEADLPGPSDPPEGPPVVVGIGLNVGWPARDDDLPPELVGRATSLTQQLGAPADREAVLAALLEGLDGWLGTLTAPAGARTLAHAFRARCSTLGTRVRVELADRTFEGRAVDLDDAGHLVVERTDVAPGTDPRPGPGRAGDSPGPSPGRRETVVAGDVVHLRPAP